MRYRDLFDAKAWRRYSGRDRECFIRPLADPNAAPREARVQYGVVKTGRQRVFVGYFVQVIQQHGGEWLAEDPHSLRRALRAVERSLNADGWSLKVIGLDAEWSETGLSANTGFGYHPDLEGPVHMMDAPAERSHVPHAVERSTLA